jgi:hypothetical protein
MLWRTMSRACDDAQRIVVPLKPEQPSGIGQSLGGFLLFADVFDRGGRVLKEVGPFATFAALLGVTVVYLGGVFVIHTLR